MLQTSETTTLTGRALAAWQGSKDCVGDVLALGSSRQSRQAPWLYEASYSYSCSALFRAKSEATMWPPPRWPELTGARRDQFTLHGLIPYVDYYLQDQANGAAANVWNATQLAGLVAHAQRGGCHCTWYGGATMERADICATLRAHKHAIEGKQGLVLGSQAPWAEALLLAFGAAHVTTIEYQPTQCEGGAPCERLRVIHPAEAAKSFLQREHSMKFDFAFSFSSYEHDGLGRYGDPLNPAGDLESVQKVRCLLKHGGLFFLGLPLNADSDALAYNAHRIYGPARLPLLTANFDVLHAPVDEMARRRNTGPGRRNTVTANDWTQPLLVLRKRQDESGESRGWVKREEKDAPARTPRTSGNNNTARDTPSAGGGGAAAGAPAGAKAHGKRIGFANKLFGGLLG